MGEISTGAVLIAAAAVLLVACVTLVVLVMRGRRNVRLLSRELDEADRTMADQTARLQVTHDLHQSAAVTLAGLVTQAEAARYLAGSDARAAQRSVAQIADAARLTLADLRRTATIAGSAPPSGSAPAEAGAPSATPATSGRQGDDAPAAGLDSVEELVHRMRAAGLVITLIETGERFGLTHAAQTAVLRIVEEALANALRHGGDGTEVAVGIGWSADGLRLTVDDDGQTIARRPELAVDEDVRRLIAADAKALTTLVAGRGISAMRERATAFGGVITTLPVPGVGFSVSVIFPSLRYDNGVHRVNLQR